MPRFVTESYTHAIIVIQKEVNQSCMFPKEMNMNSFSSPSTIGEKEIQSLFQVLLSCFPSRMTVSPFPSLFSVLAHDQTILGSSQSQIQPVAHVSHSVVLGMSVASFPGLLTSAFVACMQ